MPEILFWSSSELKEGAAFMQQKQKPPPLSKTKPPSPAY